ncbi:MAG: Txe/YoeB family addiction module toxin [Cyanobacteria bacterium J06627_32]
MKWRIVYSKQAKKDAKKLTASNLSKKAQKLIEIISINPYQTPPPYEKLAGELSGAYSRRINIQHRLVYEVFEAERTVRIARMWTHYE